MQTAKFGADWSATLARVPQDVMRGWVELGRAICDEADAIALRHFRRDLDIRTKPDRTLVTQADTEIEQLVRSRILAAHPAHGLVGEEFGTERTAAGTRWYIDPIDGTSNFVRGVPVFATLLAVEHDGELQATVISAPALGQRWWAWRGGGAWVQRAGRREPQPIRTSAVAAIEDAHLLYGSGRAIVGSGLAPGFHDLLDAAWRDRGFGDFWGYTLVAEGAGEAMLEVGLKPWDAAAPFVVVEEAGGRVTDTHGTRRIDGGAFLASNGHLHDELLGRLAGGGGASAR